MKFTIFFAVSFLGFSAVTAQTVNVNCNFVFVSNIYTCSISNAFIAGNENSNFVIAGNHQPGRNNTDVQRVQVLFSNVPFVITQLFTTFPNVNFFTMQNCQSFSRIQANAFANAQRLTQILITSNADLRTIEANAFSGAPNLSDLDLRNNQIETVHETAFSRLSQLLRLVLTNNQIRQLPVTVFQSLTGLDLLSISRNFLESLDGGLLPNAPSITWIDISRNQINAIGRNFLDNINQVRYFDAVGNLCVDRSWTLSGSTTIDTVRQGLERCFDNFISDDNELRRFVLELRGPLSLRFENGTEIVRV